MFVNLTQHEVRIGAITIAPSGLVARCGEKTKVVGAHDGIELVTREYGEVLDLPEPAQDTIYIVSAMVRMARPDRHDLASPGDLVRDAEGKIIGCKNLVVNAL